MIVPHVIMHLTVWGADALDVTRWVMSWSKQGSLEPERYSGRALCETGVPRTRITLAKSPSNDGTTRAALPSEAMIDARTLERKKRAN